MAGSELPFDLDVHKRVPLKPSHEFKLESKEIARHEFLGRLANVSEGCSETSVNIHDKNERFYVTITKCPPAILGFVFQLIQEGKIPSYNAEVDRGGVLVSFKVN